MINVFGHQSLGQKGVYYSGIYYIYRNATHEESNIFFFKSSISYITCQHVIILFIQRVA